MKTTSLVLSICFLFGGCSKVLLPYEEEANCQKGVDEGVCASMSEVYEYTLDDRPARHPKHLSKEKEAK